MFAARILLPISYAIHGVSRGTVFGKELAVVGGSGGAWSVSSSSLMIDATSFYPSLAIAAGASVSLSVGCSLGAAVTSAGSLIVASGATFTGGLSSSGMVTISGGTASVTGGNCMFTGGSLSLDRQATLATSVACLVNGASVDGEGQLVIGRLMLRQLV